MRLTLHPDGGVARLRVHGRPAPRRELLTGTVDLAALENGGDVVDCSDAFYAAARNLLLPGRATDHGGGLGERPPPRSGNDHVTVRLAGRGTVRRLVVDTSCFLGNAPGGGAGPRLSRCAVADRATGLGDAAARGLPCSPTPGRCWPWAATAATTPVDHVRLDVFPDGGLARLRVLGELVAEILAPATLGGVVGSPERRGTMAHAWDPTRRAAAGVLRRRRVARAG